MRSLKKQGGWVQYAIAGVQAVASISAAMDGSSKAERLGSANAALIELETDETLRRMELAQDQLVGEANVRAAASGFTKKGSIKGYFDDLDSEYKSRVDWTKRAGSQRQKIARMGGNAAASQIKSQGYMGALGAASNAASWYNK